MSGNRVPRAVQGISEAPNEFTTLIAHTTRMFTAPPSLAGSRDTHGPMMAPPAVGASSIGNARALDDATRHRPI
jgi:hypothetical protein